MEGLDCAEPASPLSLTNDSVGAWIKCENWLLSEIVLPMQNNIPISETLFTVGNGAIGIRGYPEETENFYSAHYYQTHSEERKNKDVVDSYSNASQLGTSFPTPWDAFMSENLVIMMSQTPRYSVRSCYFSGFFEQRILNQANQATVGAYTSESFLVRAPDAFCIDVFISGEHVSPATGKILHHSRRLDLRTGELHRRMVWESHTHDREVVIESTRFASTVNKNIAAERYTINARNVNNADIRIISRLVLPDYEDAKCAYSTENISTCGSIQDATSVVVMRTKNSCRRLAVVSVETCNSSLLSESAFKQYMNSLNYGAGFGNSNSLDGSSGSVPGSSPTSPQSGATNPINQSTTKNVNNSNNNSNTNVNSASNNLSSSNNVSSNNNNNNSSNNNSGSGSSNNNNNNNNNNSNNSSSTNISGNTNMAGLPTQSQQQQQQQQQISNVLFTPSAISGGNTATPLTPKCNESEAGTEITYTSCISDRISIEVIKYVGYFGDEDARQEELYDMAIYRTRHAANFGYDALREEHCNAMNQFWGPADVIINGPSNMQGALRYNMLQLHMSASSHPRHCFPTRGLTGEMFGGLQQWDVDAFVIPFFTHVCPEKARALIMFRINTFNNAKDIAVNFDLKRGALYPFRTINGTDSNAPYCSAFLFVNAIIALILRYYIIATHDYTVLNEGGAELVLATALVWLEWGTWERDAFHLRSVSGPDLYNGLVDDNFLTNMMAQQHMLWAVQMAAQIRGGNVPLWQQLLDKCQMTENDIVEMERAATHMTLPFDPTHRINPAHQSFMLKKRWKFEDLRTNSRQHLNNRYDTNVIFRHQLCRIPDVMLAITLLPDKFTLDEVKANFRFYEAITSQDSALRLAIYGIVSCLTHVPDKALQYFKKTLFVDLDNIVGDTGGGLHSTTAAGSWGVLVIGFGGMKLIQGVLHFDPCLPDECEGYTFNVRHRGCLVKVTVTDRLVTYSLTETPNGVEDLVLIHAGSNRIHLRKGASSTVRLIREIRVFGFDAVIFDLDSIVANIEVFHYDAWKTALEQFFRESDFCEIAVTKELYLAYLQHSTPLSGLREVFKKYDLPLPPVGSSSDSNHARTLHGLCNSKLEIFRANVQKNGLSIREGAFQLLSSLRECGVAVGCVTGSKNGRWLLDETPQLHMMFDSIIDGNDGYKRKLRWRPEMDYFEVCAKSLDAAPKRSIVVLDGADSFSKNCLERFCMVVDVSEEPEYVPLPIPVHCAHDFKEITIEVLDEVTARDWPVYHRDAVDAQNTENTMSNLHHSNVSNNNNNNINKNNNNLNSINNNNSSSLKNSPVLHSPSNLSPTTMSNRMVIT